MAEGTKVGSIFYESKIDSKGVKKGASEISKELDNLKNNFASLNPTVRALGITLGALVAGRAIVGFFKESIEAANESNRVMAQTNAVIESTGGAAGYTSEEIAKMASEIQKTTTISDEAAQQGMNMLLTFTAIGRDVFPQVTQATIDMATAMNGGLTPSGEQLAQTAIQIGKAMQDPTRGITALRRVGVNFTETQQEMIKNWIENGDQMKAQKFILNELANEFGGSAKAQANTFEGQILQLNNAFSDFKEEVGRSLIPALSYLVSALSGAAGGFDLLLAPIRVVASAVVGLIVLFRELGMVISTILATGIAVVKGQTDLIGTIWKNAVGDMILEGANAQEKLNQIWGKGTKEQSKIFAGGMQDQMDESGKKTNKIKKDLEDETEKYLEENIKRKKRFEDNMADLIWAHQDKVKQIKKDLQEENDSFNKSMAQQVSDYKEAMGEMEADHNKSTEEINKDLLQETTDHEKKVETIQAAIDKELSYGKNARQSKLTELRDQLAEEVAANSEKVAEIQGKLDEENASYAQAVAKKQEQNILETTNLQEEHTKRTSDLQIELDTEQGILNAHQSEVDAIKNKARVDDITRLQQQYAEENTEADKQHAKRMVDIVEAGKAEGGAGGGAFMGAMDDKMKQTKGIIDQATKDMAATMVTNIGEGAIEAGKKLVSDFVNSIIGKAKDALKFVTNNSLLGFGPFSALSVFKNLPAFNAQGVKNFEGGMSWVGENGPELVNLPRGADVYSNEESKAMTGQNIYINVEKIDSQMDIESIGREIGFRAGIMPR